MPNECFINHSKESKKMFCGQKDVYLIQNYFKFNQSINFRKLANSHYINFRSLHVVRRQNVTVYHRRDDDDYSVRFLI